MSQCARIGQCTFTKYLVGRLAQREARHMLLCVIVSLCLRSELHLENACSTNTWSARWPGASKTKGVVPDCYAQQALRSGP